VIAASDIAAFAAANPASVVAEITAVRGSAPREAGAFMLVSPTATLGTIGGGALEYMVIDRARQVLRSGEAAGDAKAVAEAVGRSGARGESLHTLDIPLGPEIGQCCGGRVDIAMRRLDPAGAAALIEAAEFEAVFRPHVYLFGAGHVGHALARALALLPLHVHVVDTRPAELAGLPATVEAVAAPMPEAVVRAAPIGSAFVILTHDHALDFLIALEALARVDSPYVGMVGSRTKRAKFAAWFKSEGGDPAALERLVLPIGGASFPRGLGDKRPEVIATLAAAEIMVHIGGGEVSSRAMEKAMSGAADGR
jgi:xanthine dehydrogenase accessory factor